MINSFLGVEMDILINEIGYFCIRFVKSLMLIVKIFHITVAEGHINRVLFHV